MPREPMSPRRKARALAASRLASPPVARRLCRLCRRPSRPILGRRAAGRRPAPNSFSACSAAGSTASGSRSPGTRSSRTATARSTGQASTRSSKAPPWPGSKCCRSSPERRPGPCRRSACRASHRASKRREPARPAGAAAPVGQRFVSGAVERYGPGGSFWAEHPSLPQRPIRTWQIWNEENFKYFVAKPNPAEYGKLVNALLRPRSRRSIAARRSSSAACSPGRASAVFEASSPRRPTSPPTSSTRCTRRRRGSSRSSTASPCIPTRANTRS